MQKECSSWGWESELVDWVPFCILFTWADKHEGSLGGSPECETGKQRKVGDRNTVGLFTRGIYSLPNPLKWWWVLVERWITHSGLIQCKFGVFWWQSPMQMWSEAIFSSLTWNPVSLWHSEAWTFRRHPWHPALPCMGCTGCDLHMGTQNKGLGVGLKSTQSQVELPLFCVEGFVVLWQPYWNSYGFVIYLCAEAPFCSCKDRGCWQGRTWASKCWWNWWIGPGLYVKHSGNFKKYLRDTVGNWSLWVS